MYVGDIAQQIYLGTLRTWEEIDEQIPEERQVKLQKVYRNTKEILEYIAGLGYSVVIPEHGKRGDAVVEMAGTLEKQRETVDEVVSRHEGQQIAIIAKDTKDLASYKKQYTDKQNIHVMTMSQSQGVEFDVVCVVGIREDLFSIPSSLTQENYRQKQRINRDLLYVALSRAREKLYVVGDVKLSGINMG
jgi:DNA helicase IV